MINTIYIPKGNFAADMDDAALRAKREALKKKLLEGGKITLKNDGSAVNGNDDNPTITIPKGKLAADDNFGQNTESEANASDLAVLKFKRDQLKKKLIEGGRIVLKSENSSSENDNPSISIPKGKLAAQWYEKDPQLLQMEKVAMQVSFPKFKMDKLDDGRLYWIGDLTPGIYETKFGKKKTYTVMAVYNNNHPYQVMGSSVRVYPILPDAKDIIRECGFRPHHLLRDSQDELFLCTNEALNVKTGLTTTSAASVLAWAVKWLMCYELVLTGDLDKDEFNRPGGV